MGKRSYSETTKSALFALSVSCYFPDCGVPTVTFFDESPEKKVQIAHIHAVEPNGPRWRSDVDINSFDNLMLLCSFHHKRVDAKANEGTYPAATLREWKHIAEKSIRSKVDGLDRLSEQRLEEILQNSAQAARSELDAAISLVQQTSESAADVLRAVLERLNTRFIDTDAIEMLDSAAYQLRGLEDNSMLLASASHGLANLEDHASTLLTAGEHLEHSARAIARAAESFSDSMHSTPDFSHVADSIDRAGERVINQFSLVTASAHHAYNAAPEDDARPWKYFAAGAITVLVVAIISAALALRFSA